MPLFSGIRTRGAGLGPAVAFLYSGPALDIPPLIYTFTLLGPDLGWATLGGIIFIAVVIGLSMNFIFPEVKTGGEKDIAAALPENTVTKKIWVEVVFFGLLIAIMVLTTGRSYITSLILFAILAVFLIFTFTRDDVIEWGRATWQFVRSIIPWLVVGSLGAALIGVLLPKTLVSDYVGGSSLFSCLIASVIGSLMYFCSLAQIPFVRALMDLGMGQGPALALLLTGPAVSLPSMLVLWRIIGPKRTLTYIGLVIGLATVISYIYGLIVG